jgi:hypothetical protein
MTLQQLTQLLGSLDFEPGEEDVLDVLWLAQWLGEPTSPAVTGAGEADAEPGPESELTTMPPPVPDVARTPPPAETTYAVYPWASSRQTNGSARAGSPGGEAQSASPAGRSGLGAAAILRTPAAPALGDQLRLARALRPLARKTPSRHYQQLDEEATAERIAEEDLWIPAMKPAPTRWLELALVVDGYESMVIWRRAIREFRTMLETLGAFKDVRFWVLEQASSNANRVGIRKWRASSALRSPRELVDPEGRRAIIVLSDCLGPMWRTQRAQKVLAFWARRGPVAVVQPLPQRLWGFTHIRPARVRLHSFQPGSANASLVCRVPSHGPKPRRDRVPVPVLELHPRWLASWSHVLTGTGASGVDAMVMFVGAEVSPEADAPPEIAPIPTAAELVHRFHRAASPNAARLAEFLSAAPITLPIVSLIQATMLRTSRQSEVAEVMLSGLLHRLDGDGSDEPDEIQYDFRPGVRTLLQRRLRRDEALKVLRSVSDYLARHFGQARDFQALLAGQDIKGDYTLNAGSRAFAEIAAQVLGSLGGIYTEPADRLTAAIAQPAASAAALASAQSRQLAAADAPFREALRHVSFEDRRSRQRPFVCPYCYHAFAEREIAFRCSGNAGPGRPACARVVDKVLQRKMGESIVLPPFFEADGRQDDATCPTCERPTRTQVCPACHSRLPATFRSGQGQLIALVGSSLAGKTAFMTVLIHELHQEAGEQLNAAVIGADVTSEDRFVTEYEKPLYEHCALFDRTTTAAGDFIAPLVFRFTMTQPGRFRPHVRELLLSFADSAGEDLTQPSKVDLMARYLAAADGVIVLTDPLQFQRVRERLNPRIPVPAMNPDDDDPVTAFDRITALLLAGSSGPMVRKPVAIVLSKLDALRQLLPPDSPLRAPRHKVKPYFDTADSVILQGHIKTLLDEWDASEIDRIVNRSYLCARYFAVSALGVTPTEDNQVPAPGVQPFRVTDPYMWLLSQFGFIRAQ